MEIDIRVSGKALPISIDDPHHMDTEAVVARIESFLTAQGAQPKGLDLRGLLPKMVRGVAGCESGCPANAKSLVANGFGNFKLEYIEGGILQAQTTSGDGKPVSIRMFPDF
jgi:hypothetical protein